MRHILPVTVYAVIFEGHKFRGFCCKLAECKILILEKQYLRKQCIQLDDQRKLNRDNPSDLPPAKYKTLKNYCIYGTQLSHDIYIYTTFVCFVLSPCIIIVEF